MAADLERQVAARTAELAEREIRFKALTELSSDWYWETDADGRFTTMSPGVLKIGLDPAQILGRTRRELVADTAQPGFRAYAEALSGRRAFRNLCYDVYDGAGRLRHVEMNGEPIKSLRGLREQVESVSEGKLVFRMDSGELIVIDAKTCWQSEPDIFYTHRIPHRCSPDLL